MTEGAFRSVTVVGLGVMGGSVARAVLARLPGTPVFGIDPAPGCATMAARDGVEVLAGLADAEVAGGVVVFAAPLDVTVKLVRETAATWGRAALATDVASLKHPVLAAAASPPAAAAAQPDVFVGAHPMCGSERSGYAAARADLFEGADVWICPESERVPPEPAPSGPEPDPALHRDAVARATAFWTALGGRPRMISAARHDRVMAWTSHLPQLLAGALAAVLHDQGITRDQLGPGGRGMTRLAGSSPAMWRPLRKRRPGRTRGLCAPLSARSPRCEGPSKPATGMRSKNSCSGGGDGPRRRTDDPCPGDKSITQRALILGALADGESRIGAVPRGGDPLATGRAIAALGVEVRGLEDGQNAPVTIRGPGLRRWTQPVTALDLCNSGTGTRLLAGALAAQPLSVVLRAMRRCRSARWSGSPPRSGEWALPSITWSGPASSPCGSPAARSPPFGMTASRQRPGKERDPAGWRRRGRACGGPRAAPLPGPQ